MKSISYLPIPDLTQKQREFIEHRTSPEPMSGCHLWIGSLIGDGYALIVINKKHLILSRVIYKDHYGVDPRELCVLHRCDTPCCICPQHLFLGTKLDNVRDMNRKHRDNRPKGEAHKNSVLTLTDVAEIRRLHSSGVIGKDIARQFGIGQANVSAICTGRRWRDSYKDTVTEPRRVNRPRARLSQDDASKICELRTAGYKRSLLAEMFGVHEVTISRICNGHAWKDSYVAQ